MAGPCSLSPDGDCARSPNYPTGYYDNSQNCLIVNVPRVPLFATMFATETLFDYVSVNGRRYSGSSAPDGIVPLDGTIRWTSDTSNVAAGWEICWGGNAPPSPAPPTTNDRPLDVTGVLPAGLK